MAARGGAAAALPPGNIVLVGFMASGKSAVGRALAHRTGRKLIDTDDVVMDGDLSIDELFASEGEAGFRRREKKVVQGLVRAKESVISTGGGTILDPANVKLLKRSGVIVYLRTSTDELVKRLEDDERDRPLLRSAEGRARGGVLRKRVGDLLAQRGPIYESVADHVVGCDGRAPDEVAEDIVKRLSRPEPGGVQQVKVALDPPYMMSIGRGILGSAPDLVKLSKDVEHACVISHPRIRRLWGAELEGALRGSGRRVTWLTFPAGEERKTFETSARLLRGMARAGLHRGDVVFALGGGVVGDVGAFVASTYNRGIAVVQVPTTLLAMVDSSIGGKTGVNLPQGKNLVGTFHQPMGIVADLDVLATLPERELRGGLAEVVKYGFISDPSISTLVERNRDEIVERGEILREIVVRSARIKSEVVAADEKEDGLRAILNYGHTLGHAIESLSVGGRGRKLHHGEAISIGMVYAAALSERTKTSSEPLVDAHRAVLESVGLPTRVEGVTWAEVRDKMLLDKKYARGMRFVLLEAPGKPVVTRVAPKILEAAFAEVCS